MPNSRSQDFRFVFANSIGFAFTDNESRVLFGINEDAASDDSILEQVGVVMTHKTLKLLGTLINEMIGHYERTTGNEIPIDQGKLEEIRRVIESSQGDSTSSTAS